MDRRALGEMLESVRRGETSIETALDRLRDLPYADLGFAQIDHHRALRRGIPEIVFGAGKTAEQIVAIFRELDDKGASVLATRVSAEHAAALVAALPAVRHDPVARTALLARKPIDRRGRGVVAVVTAGTSDIPVAEEAAVTAEALGNEVARIYDVGVAGIHRVLSRRVVLESAAVLVVVAGMEGALPSVVAGLVSKPVIAVPTSIGYGASFGGIAALLAMLNSCASGVTVVNIDNGFGAAYAASLINGVTVE